MERWRGMFGSKRPENGVMASRHCWIEKQKVWVSIYHMREREWKGPNTCSLLVCVKETQGGEAAAAESGPGPRQGRVEKTGEQGRGLGGCDTWIHWPTVLIFSRVECACSPNISLNFLCCIGVQPINNVVIVSGEERRDSAVHIHESILAQTPLPPTLPHDIEQSSMCHTVGPCWLSILNTAVCTWPSLTP